MLNWDFPTRFPGAQPISFEMAQLKLIQMQKTLVCEKSDGVRFLMMEAIVGKDVKSYLVDR